MRFIVVTIFLLCVYQIGNASFSVKDSLLEVLSQETRSHQRSLIYRNLADLSYDTPDEKLYLKLLIQELDQKKDRSSYLEAMGNLAMAYILLSQIDSASFYIEQFESLGESEEVICWKTYLRMYNHIAAVSEGDGTAAINESLKKLESGQMEDVYSRIENAYILANALYAQLKTKEALPYVISAEELAATLPVKNGYKIHMLTIRLLSRLLIREGQFPEAVQWMEKYINMQERYYEQYYKPGRPYYYINSLRINAYGTLMMNQRVMEPEKVEYYFREVQKYSETAASLFDKYSCYFIMNNYYLRKGELPEALMTNDSLIKFAEIIAPSNTIGLYELNSRIYEAMDRYKESLAALRISYSRRDSVYTAKAQEHLNQLQVQYDVNKLNYEKSQLEIKNKQILLISLLFILLFVILLCIYLYQNFRKERAMKEKLAELNIKAEESEKMKTVFIRSVCHEIRTPLNAIVGFADLLSMPDLDDEMRSSFPEEIHKNSVLLTSLVSRMLEVAELDVSEESLPVEPTDMHVVCVQSMERIQDNGKEGIEYILDIPEEPLSIMTNMHYLMLVLENLLDNADKFTEAGRIVLHYDIDQEARKFLITITDTGIGIPAGMHEKVFERFSKLDAYKPGNGLGLYLCRLIVKRLSGEIYIDSAYTQGTRIVVELALVQ